MNIRQILVILHLGISIFAEIKSSYGMPPGNGKRKQSKFLAPEMLENGDDSNEHVEGNVPVSDDILQDLPSEIEELLSSRISGPSQVSQADATGTQEPSGGVVPSLKPIESTSHSLPSFGEIPPRDEIEGKEKISQQSPTTSVLPGYAPIEPLGTQLSTFFGTGSIHSSGTDTRHEKLDGIRTKPYEMLEQESVNPQTKSGTPSPTFKEILLQNEKRKVDIKPTLSSQPIQGFPTGKGAENQFELFASPVLEALPRDEDIFSEIEPVRVDHHSQHTELPEFFRMGSSFATDVELEELEPTDTYELGGKEILDHKAIGSSSSPQHKEGGKEEISQTIAPAAAQLPEFFSFSYSPNKDEELESSIEPKMTDSSTSPQHEDKGKEKISQTFTSAAQLPEFFSFSYTPDKDEELESSIEPKMTNSTSSPQHEDKGKEESPQIIDPVTQLPEFLSFSYSPEQNEEMGNPPIEVFPYEDVVTRRPNFMSQQSKQPWKKASSKRKPAFVSKEELNKRFSDITRSSSGVKDTTKGFFSRPGFTFREFVPGKRDRAKEEPIQIPPVDKKTVPFEPIQEKWHKNTSISESSAKMHLGSVPHHRDRTQEKTFKMSPPHSEAAKYKLQDFNIWGTDTGTLQSSGSMGKTFTFGGTGEARGSPPQTVVPDIKYQLFPSLVQKPREATQGPVYNEPAHEYPLQDSHIWQPIPGSTLPSHEIRKADQSLHRTVLPDRKYELFPPIRAGESIQETNAGVQPSSVSGQTGETHRDKSSALFPPTSFDQLHEYKPQDSDIWQKNVGTLWNPESTGKKFTFPDFGRAEQTHPQTVPSDKKYSLFPSVNTDETQDLQRKFPGSTSIYRELVARNKRRDDQETISQVPTFGKESVHEVTPQPTYDIWRSDLRNSFSAPSSFSEHGLHDQGTIADTSASSAPVFKRFSPPNNRYDILGHTMGSELSPPEPSHYGNEPVSRQELPKSIWTDIGQYPDSPSSAQKTFFPTDGARPLDPISSFQHSELNARSISPPEVPTNQSTRQNLDEITKQLKSFIKLVDESPAMKQDTNISEAHSRLFDFPRQESSEPRPEKIFPQKNTQKEDDIFQMDLVDGRPYQELSFGTPPTNFPVDKSEEARNIIRYTGGKEGAISDRASAMYHPYQKGLPTRQPKTTLTDESGQLVNRETVSTPYNYSDQQHSKQREENIFDYRPFTQQHIIGSPRSSQRLYASPLSRVIPENQSETDFRNKAPTDFSFDQTVQRESTPSMQKIGEMKSILSSQESRENVERKRIFDTLDESVKRNLDSMVGRMVHDKPFISQGGGAEFYRNLHESTRYASPLRGAIPQNQSPGVVGGKESAARPLHEGLPRTTQTPPFSTDVSNKLKDTLVVPSEDIRQHVNQDTSRITSLEKVDKRSLELMARRMFDYKPFIITETRSDIPDKDSPSSKKNIENLAPSQSSRYVPPLTEHAPEIQAQSTSGDRTSATSKPFPGSSNLTREQIKRPLAPPGFSIPNKEVRFGQGMGPSARDTKTFKHPADNPTDETQSSTIQQITKRMFDYQPLTTHTEAPGRQTMMRPAQEISRARAQNDNISSPRKNVDHLGLPENLYDANSSTSIISTTAPQSLGKEMEKHPRIVSIDSSFLRGSPSHQQVQSTAEPAPGLTSETRNPEREIVYSSKDASGAVRPTFKGHTAEPTKVSPITSPPDKPSTSPPIRNQKTEQIPTNLTKIKTKLQPTVDDDDVQWVRFGNFPSEQVRRQEIKPLLEKVLSDKITPPINTDFSSTSRQTPIETGQTTSPAAKTQETVKKSIPAKSYSETQWPTLGSPSTPKQEGIFTRQPQQSFGKPLSFSDIVRKDEEKKKKASEGFSRLGVQSATDLKGSASPVSPTIPIQTETQPLKEKVKLSELLEQSGAHEIDISFGSFRKHHSYRESTSQSTEQVPSLMKSASVQVQSSQPSRGQAANVDRSSTIPSFKEIVSRGKMKGKEKVSQEIPGQAPSGIEPSIWLTDAPSSASETYHAGPTFSDIVRRNAGKVVAKLRKPQKKGTAAGSSPRGRKKGRTSERKEIQDITTEAPFERCVLIVPRDVEGQVDVLDEIHKLNIDFTYTDAVLYPSGSALIICRTAEEAHDLEEAVKNSRSLKIKPKKVFPRTVHIENVPMETTEEEVSRAISGKFGMSPNKVRFTDYRYHDSKTEKRKIAIIEVSSSLLKRIETSPDIQIRWQNLIIDISVRVDRCEKCHLLGHEKKYCEQPSRSYPSRYEPCIDCKHYNRLNKSANLQKTKFSRDISSHPTDDPTCPTKRYYVRKWTRKQKAFDEIENPTPEEPQNTEGTDDEFHSASAHSLNGNGLKVPEDDSPDSSDVNTP